MFASYKNVELLGRRVNQTFARFKPDIIKSLERVYRVYSNNLTGPLTHEVILEQCEQKLKKIQKPRKPKEPKEDAFDKPKYINESC